MKISYNYAFKISILLILVCQISPASSMDLWNNRQNSRDFEDFDSTEGSDQDFLPQPKVEVINEKTNTIIKSNNKKSEQYENSSEDDYAETVHANLEKYENMMDKKKQTGFFKYFIKCMPNIVPTNDLSYESRINTINHILSKHIENHSLVLNKSINDCQSNPTSQDTIIDPGEISKIIEDDLNNLRQILEMHNQIFVNVGLGYYSHKFFRLHYDQCKPIETDSLEFWHIKYKIFKTNIRCFINAFEPINLSHHKEGIKKKSETSLIDFFKDSCSHLVNLYQNRSGLAMSLSQMHYRESQTRKFFVEFTNNYLLEFQFLKSKAQIEKKILEIKNIHLIKMDKIDEDISKKGVMKTVLGESSTMVVNAGSAILNTALGQGGTFISNAGSYLTNYYNTPTQPQLQTNSNGTTSTEQKKGWFWQ